MLRYLIVVVPTLGFGVLGLVVLAVTGIAAARRRAEYQRAIRMTGVITSYRESPSSDGPTVYWPTIRGTRPSGEVFEFESGSGSMVQPSPPVGTEVEVLMSPSDPTKLWLKGHEWRSFIPWFWLGGFLAVGGLGIAAAGVVMAWIFR